MTNPRVLKGSAVVLLIVAIGMLAVALFRDGNNMWLALAAALLAFGATSLFVKAEPERLRRKTKT